MKEILMMKKTQNSLLPLRGKISPPSMLNCLDHSTEQKNNKSRRETTDAVGGRERLFSASTMSASSSKHGSTFSERDLTPPFTPPANGDRAFLFRRPSEHFLEVLEEHKQRPTVPKRRSSSCLPPLRKTTQGEDSQKKNLRGTKIAFNGYLNGEDAVSRKVEPNGGRLVVVSEQGSDRTETNLANKKILRKSHSLPLIKPYTAFTSGIDCVNVSVFENHTPTGTLNEEKKLNTCDRLNDSPIEEYSEERCDEGDPLKQDDDEETLEKFSMICHWLKECERAKVV